MTGQIAAILKNDLGVKESHEHAPKHVTPGESIETNGVVLKWYALLVVRKTPNAQRRRQRSKIAAKIFSTMLSCRVQPCLTKPTQNIGPPGEKTRPNLVFPARLPMFATQDKTVKTKSNCKITIAILTAALLLWGNYAQAGSTEPNPTALAKAATTTNGASRVVENEVHMLLGRLAKGDEFTKKFDLAAYHKDKKQLTDLMREAGMKKSKITVDSIESDMRIRITVCWDGICISISISW